MVWAFFADRKRLSPTNQEILDDLRRILRDQELQFERRVIDRADYQKLVEIYRYRQEKALSCRFLPQEQELETIVDITGLFEDGQSLPHLNCKLADEDLGLIQEANQGTIVSVVNKTSCINPKTNDRNNNGRDFQLIIY